MDATTPPTIPQSSVIPPQPVGTQPATVLPVPEQPSVAPVAAPPVESSSAKKKGLLVGGIVLLALIAIGVIVFLGKSVLFRGDVTFVPAADETTCLAGGNLWWAENRNSAKRCADPASIPSQGICTTYYGGNWNAEARACSSQLEGAEQIPECAEDQYTCLNWSFCSIAGNQTGSSCTLNEGVSCNLPSAPTRLCTAPDLAMACSALNGTIDENNRCTTNSGSTNAIVYMWTDDHFEAKSGPTCSARGEVSGGSDYHLSLQTCEYGGQQYEWNGSDYISSADELASETATRPPAQIICEDTLSGNYLMDNDKEYCGVGTAENPDRRVWDPATNNFVAETVAADPCSQLAEEVSGTSVEFQQDGTCTYQVEESTIVANCTAESCVVNQAESCEATFSGPDEGFVNNQCVTTGATYLDTKVYDFTPSGAAVNQAATTTFLEQACNAQTDMTWRNNNCLTANEVALLDQVQTMQSQISNLQNQLNVAQNQGQSTSALQQQIAQLTATLNERLATAPQQIVVQVQQPAAATPAATTPATSAATTSASGGGIPSTSPPPIVCPPGFTYDSTTQACVTAGEVAVTPPRKASPEETTPAVEEEEEIAIAEPEEEKATEPQEPETAAGAAGVSSATDAAADVSTVSGAAAAGAGEAASSAAASASVSTKLPIAAAPRASSGALHGAYIQGRTGPGLLLYSVLLGAANAMWFIQRKRKKK